MWTLEGTGEQITGNSKALIGITMLVLGFCSFN